jgi:hypothetical protein
MARHGDELIDAIRAGRGTQYLDDLGDLGKRVLANDDYLRTIGRLGDNAAGLLDNIDDGIRAGQDVSSQIRTLFKGADNIPPSLLNKLDEAARLAKQTADELARTGSKFDEVEDLISRSAPRPGSAAAKIASAPAHVQKGILNKPLTLARQWKFKAIGVAAVATPIIIEVESGGAITQATLEGLLDTAEWAMEQDIPYADQILSTAIAAATKISDYKNWLTNSGQNLAVKMALQEKEDGSGFTEESIKRAKGVAIAAQLAEPAGLAIDFYALLRANDMKYGDLPKLEKDKKLAEAIIDRMVERSQFNALEDHQVSKEDVIGYLVENKNIVHSNFVPDRIKEALVAYIPDLELSEEQQQEVERENTQRLQDAFSGVSRKAQEMVRLKNLSGSALSEEFNNVVEQKSLSLFSSFNMFAAKVLDWIGLDSFANHFKRQVIINSMVDDFTNAARGTGNEEETPQASAPQASAVRRPAYAPAP